MQQLEDDQTLAFSIEYTPLQQFVNLYINKQITEQFLLEENLEMIKKVFLGFQSDFVTNYCQMQSEYTGELHKLQAENDLDYLLRQSQFYEQFDSNVLQKLSVRIMRDRRRFTILYQPGELQCVIDN